MVIPDVDRDTESGLSQVLLEGEETDTAFLKRTVCQDHFQVHMNLGSAVPHLEIYPEEMVMNIPSFTSKDVRCSIMYRNRDIKATKLSDTRKLVELILT